MITPANPTSLALAGASLSVSGPVDAVELRCSGVANVGGNMAVGGGVTIAGELELGGGMDARGNHITNVYLDNAGFRGAVLGDVAVEGGVKIEGLALGKERRRGGGFEMSDDGGIEKVERGQRGRADGSGRERMVAVGVGGDLRVARGVEFDEEEGVIILDKLSGHKVSFVKPEGHALVPCDLDRRCQF